MVILSKSIKNKCNVSWFSAGVSSFIATYLERDNLHKIIYTHIDNQHEDSLRFIKDCEKALGKEIEILQSPYKNVESVVKQFKFTNSPYGAKCTEVLKKRVRKKWEYLHTAYDITYVWGYDKDELQRAERLQESMPNFKHKFPLIEHGLTKEDCHAMLKEMGIKRPIMYDMGYPNNNCIGCVKGGMGYWNKIRVDFPDVFDRMAKLERQVNRSCITDVYLDELAPDRGHMNLEVLEDCGIACELALELL